MSNLKLGGITVQVQLVLLLISKSNPMNFFSIHDANANKIALSNPISAELSVMRSSLWAGLLQSVESNQRRGHNNARFFEIGLCFSGVNADEQASKLAGVISGYRFDAQ
jgi:phenylalanyl-tRNA synthetase beta chain